MKLKIVMFLGVLGILAFPVFGQQKNYQVEGKYRGTFESESPIDRFKLDSSYIPNYFPDDRLVYYRAWTIGNELWTAILPIDRDQSGGSFNYEDSSMIKLIGKFIDENTFLSQSGLRYIRL